MDKQFVSDDPGCVSIEEFITSEWTKKVNESISCCLDELASHCVKNKLTSKQHAKIYTKIMDIIRNIVDSRLKNFFSIKERYENEIAKASALALRTDKNETESLPWTMPGS